MRNTKLDLYRGMLMIYIIVIIHGVFWLNLIPIPYSTILLLEMPLIFLLSGYTFGLTSKDIHSIDLLFYWKYSKARLSRLLIPYFAYVSVCALLMIFINKGLDYPKILFAWFNPFSFGNGHTTSSLNWHLWFIPSFLIVTLMLPICKIKILAKIPTISAFLTLCLLFLILSHYRYSFATTIIFYFIWAYLGYKLSTGFKFKRNQLLLIASFAILILLVAKFGFNASLDMQSNKFPPNFLFLIFSIFWVVLSLLLSPKVPSNLVNHIAKNKIVKIFILYGYTIYLWQGLGYSIARHIYTKIQINIVFVWLIGILFTLIFGILASPLEKIRWRQSK